MKDFLILLYYETASKPTLFHLEFKKQCLMFWGLKSGALKNHLEYQSFCSWTRVLSSETASKQLLFHLEFQENIVSKCLESEFRSSEESSGISAVLLMEPGLVF